ncbi:MAG: DNA replication/repair protein RecF, partial [Solirubrobacterales bacterium]
MSTPECAPPSGARGSATHVRVLGFRNLADQEVELGTGLTLLWGANGAGKTNLLEAVCVGLTGQSCRTRNDREMVAFEERLGRVEVDLADGTERRRLLWSFGRDGDRRHLIDDKPAPADQSGIRPPVAIFIPDRLALLKGPPAGRRGHLDALLGALWPARAELRRAYGRALAQRNALLGRIRGGSAPRDSLDAWDLELARAGVELVAARAEAVGALASEFASAGAELGLRGEPELRYRPRSDASDASELASELSSRRDADLGRGHTTHGPHLDEVEISLGARSARRYASQGEQRAAVLALLFAERRALLDARGAPPLMLLDDVMSELDPDRRALLAARLAEGGGQALLTATERDQLPADCERLELQMSAGIPARPSIRHASTPPLRA